MSQSTTCLCILSLVALLGCSEEKASQAADGGPLTPAVDAGGRAPTGSTLDGGLDGGRRDGGSDREDEDEDESNDEDTSDVEREEDAGRNGGEDDEAEADGLELTVPAIDDDLVIDPKYRCDPETLSLGLSPEISWSAGPRGTKSYAVTLRALDTVRTENWTIYDIPQDTTSLPEGVPVGAEIVFPVVARQAANADRPAAAYGYRGPCDLGEWQYKLTVYALDVETLPGLLDEPYGEDVDKVLGDHVLSKGELNFSSAPP